MRRTAIAAAAFTALCGSAFAETRFDAGGAQFFKGSEPNSLVLVGTITPDTLPRFQEAIAEYPDTKTIELMSEGGSVIPAIQIAYEIFDRGLDTRITDGSMCYSACGFVFLAGERRDIDGYDALGLHQFRPVEGDMTSEQNKALTDYIVAALETFGTDPALIAATLETSSSEMRVFDWEDIVRYGIVRGQELPVVQALQAQ